MNRNRQEKGITLIALVITIIILLILAGITIMYTMGENSIFKKAQEAKNKTEDAIKNEQEYMNQVDNMINGYINGTGNGGNNNPTEPENPWAKIDRIAKAIANDENITNNSTQATGITEKGENYEIKVGDIFEVKYNEETRRVRVLGFKHDDLVDRTVYGGVHDKASISFEFLDFMTGDTYMSMNATDTNENGWGAMQMRKDLNGYSNSNSVQSGAIGGLGINLNNKSYIKQVKKKYIATYNKADSVTICNDYLWLLASSEIVPQNSDSTRYGVTITSEGNQYKYYQGVTEEWNEISMSRIKYNESGSEDAWCFRSPHCDNSKTFCAALSNGNIHTDCIASATRGVAPGFCI